MNKEKVIIAMSGGVDSSTAAILLLEQGYEVIGVNLRIWEYDATNCSTNSKTCCSPEDIKDAREVSYKLKIPFHVIKLEKEFESKVINRFIEDYRTGRTPNPCVECNTFLKFGILAQKAKELGIYKIATGHYAKVHFENNRYSIEAAKDQKKNQSYYLYGLSQENIQNAIFPLGDLEKSEVRQIAAKYGLKTANKSESMEVCFIPENDYRQFLQKKGVQFTPGFFKFVTGEIIGKHNGKENFTIGQRKGLGLSWKNPLYVVSIQDDGTVILGEESDTHCKEFDVVDYNFQAIDELGQNEEIEARVQIRYRHTPARCKVQQMDNRLRVTLIETVRSVTPGQSAVFYPVDKNFVLIGGIIQLAQK